MNENIDIDKLLLPTNLEIQGSPGDGLYCEFLDEELDYFRINFNHDMAATIMTDGNTYIVLSVYLLDVISDLVYIADEMYEDYFSKEML